MSNNYDALASSSGDPLEELFRPKDYPFFPLKNTVVFPRTMLTLTVGREKSVRAIEEVLSGEKQLVVATQKDGTQDDPAPGEIYQIGTLVEIISAQRQADGNVQVKVEGLRRVKIQSFMETEAIFRVSITRLPENLSSGPQVDALVRHVSGLFERYAQLNRRISSEAVSSVVSLKNPARLSDLLAAHIVTDIPSQQDLLETLDAEERLNKTSVILGNEIEILELEGKIKQRVRQQVDKNQKEYYLKEQLRAIQEELGHDLASELEELRQRVAAKGLTTEAEAKVKKELERLERMPTHSAEMVVLRNYVDWILALPWSERTQDHLDMNEAQRILDDDHFGLEKVKERIIEFLAVRQLRANADMGQSNKGPILCLVGPPGVGKTSLGRSIAKALGRKFVRISLGGVHDEAEIRGHRRTYVSALPGRILQSMKSAGVCNPVFLLDEVDKLSSDYRGNPSAALLEVLDPEQNNTFTDHYLEVPYDLSEVFFICTANVRYTIPQPLADRMDIVEIPGYMVEEKVAIGRRHLLPKVLKEHGLTPTQLQVPDKVMNFIVTRYTREAGVRNLERLLAATCRKVARKVLAKPTTRIRLTAVSAEAYLGIPRYAPDSRHEQGIVGVATGLAWTEHGGVLLPVEVATMPGKGDFMITGQLGDVMQESARAALSYIRSRATLLKIDPNFQEHTDLHIHLPEGAIPKDGPSAGITIATAIISALTKSPVRNDLAMTGEITLRGRVLPIGGLKEKALAAHRAGITILLIPHENKKDLADIPPKVLQQMTLIPVETMDQVLDQAFVTTPPQASEGNPVAAGDTSPVAAESILPVDTSTTAVPTLVSTPDMRESPQL